MDAKSMTRKEFVTLTFTLIGGAATAAACSSSSNNTGTGGTNGTTGLGGANGTNCTDPLPETQLPDTTGHMHTITVHASELSATMNVTLTTSQPVATTDGGTVAAHTHMVTLTTANLATLSGGGSIQVTSTNVMSHMHTYLVSCTAGTGSGGSNGAAGSQGAGGTAGASGSNGTAGTSGAAGA